MRKLTVQETEDCVKLTWSIHTEFERIKDRYNRLKAERKQWKREFKALKKWVKTFNEIIENEQKQQSMISCQKGAKDED